MAISADSVEETTAHQDRLQPWFLLGSDPELTVIREWGVADTRGPYARPATFVVKKGDIVYRYLGKNKQDRPPIDEVLEALRERR